MSRYPSAMRYTLIPLALLLFLPALCLAAAETYDGNAVRPRRSLEMWLFLHLATITILYYSVFILPLGFLLGAWLNRWRALRKAPELREFFEEGRSWRQLRRSLAYWCIGSLCLLLCGGIVYTREPDNEDLLAWLVVASVAFAAAWVSSIAYIVQLYRYLKSPQALRSFEVLAKPPWQARYPRFIQRSLKVWPGMLLLFLFIGQAKLLAVMYVLW